MPGDAGGAGTGRSVWRRRDNPHLTPYTEIFALIEGLVRGKAVLDAGSELGDETGPHAPSSEMIVGVERDEAFLRSAYGTYKGPNIHFIRGDLEHLEFLGDAKFDVVFSNYTIEHLESPGSFFREASRILRPGGVLAVVTPNVKSPVMALTRLLPASFVARVKRSLVNSQDFHPLHYRANSVARLDALLGEHGLRRAKLLRYSSCAYFVRSRVLFALWLAGFALSEVGPLGWLKGTIYAEYVKDAGARGGG